MTVDKEGRHRAILDTLLMACVGVSYAVASPASLRRIGVDAMSPGRAERPR